MACNTLLSIDIFAKLPFSGFGTTRLRHRMANGRKLPFFPALEPFRHANLVFLKAAMRSIPQITALKQ
jgi:hypothetical protein